MHPYDLFNSPDFVQKITSGDEYAFRELTRVMLPRLVSYVLRRYLAGQHHLSRSDAEDIAQETMLNVSRAVRSGRYAPRPNIMFTTWIFRIAHNQAVNYHRQLERRKEIPLEGSGVDDPYNAPLSSKGGQKEAGGRSVGEAIVAISPDPAKKLHVEEALGVIDKKYRDILLLVHEYGYSKEEIAQRHGVRVNTVDQWLSRARKQFKDAYAKL